MVFILAIINGSIPSALLPTSTIILQKVTRHTITINLDARSLYETISIDVISINKKTTSNF